MRTLVYFFIIGIGGYYAYTAIAGGGLDRAKAAFQQVIAPAEIPRTFQGRYVSDLVANARYAKEASFSPKVTERFYSYVGREVLEIGPRSLGSTIGRNKEVQQLKPVAAGKGFVEVEVERGKPGQKVRSRITGDDDGIWIVSSYEGDIIKERFRRLP